MSDAPDRDRLFEEIVESNRRRIFAIARSFAPHDDRPDLCQEILLHIWKGLDGFRGGAAPSTWVYRIALNTAITYRRRNGRRVESSGCSIDESGLEPVSPASSSDELLVLDEFLRSLGKIDRAVFLLYLEDLTYREIAEITGLGESNVGVRINRLKRSFTQRFCGGPVNGIR